MTTYARLARVAKQLTSAASASVATNSRTYQELVDDEDLTVAQVNGLQAPHDYLKPDDHGRRYRRKWPTRNNP